MDSDRLNEHNLHAELGQIVAGKTGRERDDETILSLAPRIVDDRRGTRRRAAGEGEARVDRSSAAFRMSGLGDLVPHVQCRAGRGAGLGGRC